MKLRIRWGKPAAGPAKIGSVLPENGLTSQECGSSAAHPVIIGRFMIEAFGASDTGCVRANNEDYFLICPDLGLYLVADGMGGAKAGEHASKLAAETVRDAIAKREAPSLGNAFEQANRRVIEVASHNRDMEGMGTTLIAALATEHGLMIASVGDSRAYLAQNGRLRAVTEDQTWVNEVGRKLGLDDESMKTHPMKHVLTMAIGVSDQLRVHTYLLKLEPESQVLLCSDGLHGVVADEEIAAALASPASLEAKCRTLIAGARGKGGPDNITTVLLKIS